MPGFTRATPSQRVTEAPLLSRFTRPARLSQSTGFPGLTALTTFAVLTRFTTFTSYVCRIGLALVRLVEYVERAVDHRAYVSSRAPVGARVPKQWCGGLEDVARRGWQHVCAAATADACQFLVPLSGLGVPLVGEQEYEEFDAGGVGGYGRGGEAGAEECHGLVGPACHGVRVGEGRDRPPVTGVVGQDGGEDVDLPGRRALGVQSARERPAEAGGPWVGREHLVAQGRPRRQRLAVSRVRPRPEVERMVPCDPQLDLGAAPPLLQPARQGPAPPVPALQRRAHRRVRRAPHGDCRPEAWEGTAAQPFEGAERIQGRERDCGGGLGGGGCLSRGRPMGSRFVRAGRAVSCLPREVYRLVRQGGSHGAERVGDAVEAGGGRARDACEVPVGLLPLPGGISGDAAQQVRLRGQRPPDVPRVAAVRIVARGEGGDGFECVR
ncbi:hypothetical protein GCM10018785_68640 [Streptomyces longispororuber]|uniref:Uncharacterized protein n=1 Tax=Streptomyces longispororuber TaxID=68230 RepID=A0A919DWS8_9ACTN|nr:hypothetical protein GCM10018785_68640 [Streptomyces longispororuber]